MVTKTNRKKKISKLSIARGKCVGCSYCKLNCPADAMIVKAAIARPTKDCTLCGACVWVCPVNAISLA